MTYAPLPWARTLAFGWMIAATAGLLGAARPAHAQQVKVLDVTYTATADNTDDSHFRVDPNQGAPGSPSDWTKPVDYSKGSIHVHFDVLSKPSNKTALLNICFEGTPNYACMPYSDPFAATGSYDFEKPFSSFYQGNMVDWSIKLKKIPLIIKDETEKKPQADPNFYPTMMHVTLTLVAQGTTYVRPAEMQDAGADSGAPDVMQPDAATPNDAGTTKPVVDPPKPDAGKPAQPTGTGGAASTPVVARPAVDAGARMPTGSGGSSGGASGAPETVTADDTGGCSVHFARGRAGADARGLWVLAAALALLWWLRATRHRA